jgi:hypothetical protein
MIDEPNPLQCPTCEREFEREFQLQIHRLAYKTTGEQCRKPKTPH